MPTSLKERALKARLANWADGRADARKAACALLPKITVVTDPDRLTEDEVVQAAITYSLKAVENAGAKLRPDDARQMMLFDLGLPDTMTVRRDGKTESVDSDEMTLEDVRWVIFERRRQINDDIASVAVWEAVLLQVEPLMLRNPKLRLGEALLLR